MRIHFAGGYVFSAERSIVQVVVWAPLTQHRGDLSVRLICGKLKGMNLARIPAKADQVIVEMGNLGAISRLPEAGQLGSLAIVDWLQRAIVNLDLTGACSISLDNDDGCDEVRKFAAEFLTTFDVRRST